jgi:hypothetical protein
MMLNVMRDLDPVIGTATVKHVLIVMQAQGLAMGIASLLRQTGGMMVVTGDDVVDVRAEVARLRPSVLIVDTTTTSPRLPEVMAILTEVPQLRVLVVHHETNCVYVYDKREMMLESASEFIHAVEGAWAAARPSNGHAPNGSRLDALAGTDRIAKPAD